MIFGKFYRLITKKNSSKNFNYYRQIEFEKGKRNPGMMEETPDCLVCEIFNNLFSAIALVLIIFGTLGNLFASYVCLRPSLQKKHTFRILSVLFIHQILSLYTWNLDIFLLFFWPSGKGAFLKMDQITIIESLSIETCKIFTFMQYYSLQCISWLILYVSVNQYVKLYFPDLIYSRKPKYVYPVCMVRVWLVLIVLLFFSPFCWFFVF